MKKSTTAVLVVLVVALVALVGYLFYNQGQLQAGMDQQWKESAALLAKEQKETAMFRQSYSNSIYEVTKRVKVEYHTEELTAEPFVITSAGTKLI